MCVCWRTHSLINIHSVTGNRIFFLGCSAANKPKYFF